MPLMTNNPLPITHHLSPSVSKEPQMDTATAETLATIDRFNVAFNRHDVDAVMALMTDDVLFENTSPPPDGERHVGQAAVRAFWEQFFAGSPRAHFEAEDIFAAGDRCAVRWRYS